MISEYGSTSVGAAQRNSPDPNKGHHTFDSEDRQERFYSVLSSGWEEEYINYRRSWHKNPPSLTIPDYPLCIDLELSSACNLSCPMCYTTTEHFKENVTSQNMSFDTIKSIIDETAGKVPSLRLSWRGEPMLNPAFVKTVEYAKRAGFHEVSTLTNGTYLTLDTFIELVKAGIDWITVSIDGMLAEYDAIRAPLRFQDTYRKLLEIQYYKRKNSLTKPLIKVQGVWNAIAPDPELFYEVFKPVTDLIAFNPLIDYLGKDELENIQYEDSFTCPKQYQRLFIGSDGKASVCNADEYGTVDIGTYPDLTIHGIWHGPKMEAFRQSQLERNGFMQHEVCKRCFYPRKVEQQEVGTVHGRPIIVENYIGRKQEIGA